ncbi:HET-domain-containing protein, partial [Stipitochalara longipes BDJ]
MIQKVLVVKKKNPSDHPEIAKLEEILDAVTREIASQESLRHRNNTFIYDTLNSEKHEIRLVYIEKSATNDPLQAHLVPVSLDDDPSFEALSYVWGDQQHPGILNLNGHELEITNNLKAALLQLRLETKDRVLWVDAICINQEDLKERSEQVQMMREIYSKAKRTIVWLGEPEADSDLAMTFLKKLETHPAPEEFALNTLNSIQDDTLYDSLQSLLVKRPYWRRLWIIQELFCARDVVVHCG